jgi:hypothetical protein
MPLEEAFLSVSEVLVERISNAELGSDGFG